MSKTTKTKYLIRNWAEYNRALINRGSLSIWFSEDLIEKWNAQPSSRRGRPRKYSDDAILCALMIKAVYKLPFRALRGFMLSIVGLMGLSLQIPCYTRICRRAAELGQEIKRFGSKKVTDIVFDSSGLKVYGEGEWKVKKHGKGKRRTWRKIHLAVCPDSHNIVIGYLGENSEADCEAVPKMVKHLPRSVRRGYGDGAYDPGSSRVEFHNCNIDLVAPPRRGAILHDLEREPWMKNRNDAIRAIRGLGNDEEARKIWKILSEYHTRSLGETAFYRWKTLLGDKLQSRKLKNQRGEVYAKSRALNTMTALGMPKGEWVPA
jgi:Transposase DDE domain